MALRQIILAMLFKNFSTQPEGASFHNIVDRLGKHMGTFGVHINMGRDVTVVDRIERLLAMMVEHGELEIWRPSWYRLTATAWLKLRAKEKEAVTT
jgi:hypothetical protein